MNASETTKEYLLMRIDALEKEVEMYKGLMPGVRKTELRTNGSKAVKPLDKYPLCKHPINGRVGL